MFVPQFFYASAYIETSQAVGVCAKFLNSINRFIENRKEKLSDKEVKKIVNMLKNHVTI